MEGEILQQHGNMAEFAKTPPSSGMNSPMLRSSSPSPSVSPSIALDAIPPLDRSVSTPSNSSASTLSTRSRQSRLSDGAATVVRRRGYMRPQGTAFAVSARNRDSVMSLGSIAHMQYYFARTGLLDGKGAQLAKDEKKRGSITPGKENVDPISDDSGLFSLTLQDAASNYAASESGYDRSVVGSPTDLHEHGTVWSNYSTPPMLPPTVSTYKMKPSYTQPLPDLPVLRRELKEALQDACKVLEEAQEQTVPPGQAEEESNTLYELQGVHMLDILTLAIRAAKNYYTAHSRPEKLYDIKSEKDIRADLYQVLDILKRMASRNFRGGIRIIELTGILGWIESIHKILKTEEQQDKAEAAERESWVWRQGDWTSRERERERLFLKSFDPQQPALPPWPERSEAREYPNDFLKSLQDGQRLVKFHNALVARSRRKFGEIKSWHTDVGKPYRMAENIRYWQKAAELRFDIRLSISALEVVNGKAWEQFDEAVLKWSRGVRLELMEELSLEEQTNSTLQPPPELRVDVPDDENDIAIEVV